MKLKEWFTSPDKWTQRGWARTAQDEHIFANDPKKEPISICLLGAMIRLCPDEELAKNHGRVQEYIKNTGFVVPEGVAIIPRWNNDPTRKFEEVQKLVNDLDI